MSLNLQRGVQRAIQCSTVGQLSRAAAAAPVSSRQARRCHTLSHSRIQHHRRSQCSLAAASSQCAIASISARSATATTNLSSPQRQFASDAASASSAPLLKTALYDEHVRLGGKMVPFAGYELPVQYAGSSLMQSHQHCRDSAGLFDVSHMGQLRIWGDRRIQFLESILPADIAGLAPNQSRLSVLLNAEGGILDDCMLTHKADHIYMVVNAGCKEKDVVHMRSHLREFNSKHGADVQIEELGDKWQLLALQGPKAVEVLKRLLPPSVDLAALPFMYSANLVLQGGIHAVVNRCGYTGEDGCEIAVKADRCVELFNLLLAQPEVQPAGLGARDSLRLEAGLCLYGHDLDENLTPIEAGLSWLIGKKRRADASFLGAARVLQQLKDGVDKKRVGLVIHKGAPAREGAEILAQDSDDVIGRVTSGAFSPCLSVPISMAYLSGAHSKVGTQVRTRVRGKIGEAEVVKMPFVAAKYFKAPKPQGAGLGMI